MGCGLRWCSRRTSKTGGTWPSTSVGTATRPARKHQATELAAASPACKRQWGNVCAGMAPHAANAAAARLPLFQHGHQTGQVKVRAVSGVVGGGL